MKKNPSTFLAWRYILFKQKEKNVSFMIKICFLGILIGTFALMLTQIITNGFEKTIHEKMQGINSQVIITAPSGHQLNYENLKETLKKEFPNKVTGISASSIRQTILSKNKTHNVLLLKGVDEEFEHKVSVLHQKIIQPEVLRKNKKALQELLIDNSVIIGYKTAQNYGFKIGDEIELLVPEATGKRRISLRKKIVVISGIFKIGLEEFDNNFAFTSLEYLNEIFDEQGVDQINLKLRDEGKKTLSFLWKRHRRKLSLPFMYDALKWLGKKVVNLFVGQSYEERTLMLLRDRFDHLQINSWKDLYPALVSSLKLEKYVMFFILALITLVASMNMISLLFMQIQQKRPDIAILKAMGMPNNKIRSIFVQIGLSITLLASTIGLGLAALAGYFLERYPFIKLPDVYFVSHLPARMDVEIFVVVFAATLLLGFLASWIPARRTKNIEIAQVLRQE